MSGSYPPTGNSSIRQGVSAPQSGGSTYRVLKAAGNSAQPSITPLGFRRSCLICYRRKVKCDRREPCSNCVRWNISCQYPDPTRVIRRPRKPAVQDAAALLERLRTLESVVEQWSSPPENTAGNEADDDSEKEPGRQEVSMEKESSDDGQPLDHDLGRLMLDQGRSRYVQSNFWANLSDEVEDLTSLLLGDSDDGASSASSWEETQSSASAPQAFVMGFSSLMLDLSSLRPRAEKASFLWDIFVKKVDPHCKILHKPTMQKIINQSGGGPATMAKNMDPLVFSIYLAAVAKLSSDDCKKYLLEDKNTLLSRYRFAAEQALARAEFLSSAEVSTLQALVVFMVCVHQLEDSRFVWALVGIAGRLAQSIGLHRDGSTFSLPPFETEMRRRLWWQIYATDTRIAEDHGTRPTIFESAFDTKFPLNVNDNEIYPGMTKAPIEHQGWTEATHTLLRFQVSHTIRRINHRLPEFQSTESAEKVLTLDDQKRIIEECTTRLESKYLIHCNMNDHLSRIAANTTRLMLAKMWLMVYQSPSRSDHGNDFSPEIRLKLFLSSINVIEYSRLLQRDTSTTQRSWLLRLYFEWQAVRLILSELRLRTRGKLADRGWKAIDAISRDWDQLIAHSKRGAVWRPLQKLLVEAKGARDAAMAADMPSYSIARLGGNAFDSSMAASGTSMSLSGSGFWQDLPLEQGTENLDFQDIYGFEGFSESLGWGTSPAASLQQFDGWPTRDTGSMQSTVTQPFSFDGPGWAVADHQFSVDQASINNGHVPFENDSVCNPRAAFSDNAYKHA